MTYDKIVVSGDWAEVAAYLQCEFALAHPRLPNVERMAAEVPFVRIRTGS